MDRETLEDIYKESLLNKEIADGYLKIERQIPNTNIGYLFNHKIDGYATVHTSIVIPIYSPDGTIGMLEFRNLTNGVYNKLVADDYKQLLYFNNPTKIGTHDACIFTEAVIDAKTIESYEIEDIDVISSTRASVSKQVLHMIALVYNYIYIAFDNDEAGKENTDRIIKFYEKHYPDIEVDVIDYLGKDINKFHTDNGMRYCKRVIEEQL